MGRTSDVPQKNTKQMPKKEFWLITTDHLEDRLLFKDVEDFRVGMNYVAVHVYKTLVEMLAFILMSNHLHFVVYATREEAMRFVNGYKQQFSRYLQRKYGVHEHLRGNSVDLELIPLDGESLERAIAYVQMNCVAANICGSPWVYPWGTGACFFDGPMEGMPTHGALTDNGIRPLAALSARERFHYLRSKEVLPGDWLLSADGYILPSSFVRKDWVENRFGSPKRMNFFLQNSSKAKLRIEASEKSLPAFKDQVILAALPDLCRSLFHRQGVQDLVGDELPELMRQIRFRFAANVNQIARVTGFTYEKVAAYLDRA